MIDKRKFANTLGKITLVTISSLIIVFIFIPMIILPPFPAPLFLISNHDEINHTVEVEIIDSNNNSIFIESFDINPDELFRFYRVLDWCSKGRFYWLSWDEGSYTFNVTLDDTYNTSHYTELCPSTSVWITINSNYPNHLDVHDVSSD